MGFGAERKMASSRSDSPEGFDTNRTGMELIGGSRDRVCGER